MNQATATEAATTLQRLLQDLIDCGEIDGTLRSYSGRCMYGKTCLGLDVERDFNPIWLGVRLAEVAQDESDPNSALDDLLEQTHGMRSDSMGLGSIFYWPDVPFVGEDP